MKIGAGTKIHPLSNIYCEEIGEHCTVANFVEIGKNVSIGDFCSIQAFAYIPEGVMIGDNVFVGPHVCFTNCRYPSANQKYMARHPECGKSFVLEKTIVHDHVMIGAGSVILCGITIGEGALIGAGSVVVKDVKPGEKVIQKIVKLIGSRTTTNPDGSYTITSLDKLMADEDLPPGYQEPNKRK